MPDKLVVVFAFCIALTAVTTTVAVLSIKQQKTSDNNRAAAAQHDQLVAAVNAVQQMVSGRFMDMRIASLSYRAWLINYAQHKPGLLQNRTQFMNEWNQTLFDLWMPIAASSKELVTAQGISGFGFNAQFTNATSGDIVPLTWQGYLDTWLNGSFFPTNCASEYFDENCVAHAVSRPPDGAPVQSPDVEYTFPQYVTWTDQDDFLEAVLPWPAGDGTSFFFLTHQTDFHLNGRHVNVQTYGATSTWANDIDALLRPSQECIVVDPMKYPIVAHLESDQYAKDFDTCMETFAVNATTMNECLMKPADTHANPTIRALYLEAFPQDADLASVHNFSMWYQAVNGVEKLVARKTLIFKDHLKLHLACMETDVRSSPADATKSAAALGVPMSLLIVLMVCLAYYLSRERHRQHERDEKSVELTTNIAGALCEYDLEYVDLLLDAYATSADHNDELVKPLRDLRSNLGEYRPYLPRYLLPDDGHIAAKQSTEGGSSRGSVTSTMSKLSCPTSEKYALHQRHNDVAKHHEAVETDIARKIVLAAVDFIGSTYCRSATKSKLTTASSINEAAVAVHNAIAATGGVLHCFIGDSVVASWNSVKQALQPEKKACRFLCLLRSDPVLKHLQPTGAAVTGDATCHNGGDTKQRTLVLCAPSAFTCLETARTFAQKDNTLVILSTVRAGAKGDFRMMPYNVHDGAVYYEILNDMSDEDNVDEEWMYRLAKVDNDTDAQLDRFATHWAAGRLDEARREIATVTTEDSHINSRLDALKARVCGSPSS